MQRQIWKAALLVLMVMQILPAATAQFRGYTPEEGYQYLAFGSYPQTENGDALPVVWRVLEIEDGCIYAVSDAVLDVRRIDADQWNYKGWTDSELFAWLQTDMLNAMFMPAQRAALQSCPDLGKISLPSSDDLKNAAFGFGSAKSLRFSGTPYAVNQGLYQYNGGAYSPVWTRTPSSKPHAHRSTKVDGNIGFIGVESDDLGILPVIWIGEDCVTIDAGSGTRGDPFVLSHVIP